MTNLLSRRSLLLGGVGAGALTLFGAEGAEAYPTSFTLAPINQSRDRVLHAGKLTTDKTVWLTFDDRGTDTQVNSILATLWSYNVRGVFFPQGDFARYHPSLIRAMRNQGHIIGNHSYNHPDMTTLSDTNAK